MSELIRKDLVDSLGRPTHRMVRPAPQVQLSRPTPALSVGLPTPPPMFSTWRELLRVFPEMGDQPSINEVRVLTDQMLCSALSIEAHRRFPQTDVADAGERHRLLKSLRAQMITDLRLQPDTTGVEDALEMASSSSDAYGRGLEESRSLASWALLSEWNLGRSLGLGTDVSGVPYDMPFGDFTKATRDHFEAIIKDAFGDESREYAQIIERVSGRPPINPSLLPAELLRTRSKRSVADDAATPDDRAAEELKRSVRPPAASPVPSRMTDSSTTKRPEPGVGKVLGELLSAFLGPAESDSTRKYEEKRSRRAQAREQEAWEELRDRQLDYYRRRERAERKRKGYLF